MDVNNNNNLAHIGTTDEVWDQVLGSVNVADQL